MNAKKKEKIEAKWTVAGAEGRSVVIEREDEDIVIVWMCGDRRRFTVGGLEDALEDFELSIAHANGAEVWVNANDRVGQPYAAAVIDGQFTADSRLAAHRMHDVPWEEFRAALHAAVEGNTDQADS